MLNVVVWVFCLQNELDVRSQRRNILKFYLHIIEQVAKERIYATASVRGMYEESSIAFEANKMQA